VYELAQGAGDQIDLKRVRRGITVVAVLGIIAAAILVATTFNRQTIVALLRINPIFLFYAICFLVVSWIFSGLPFYVLTRIVGKPIDFSSSMLVYLAGSFFGFVTPFGSGLLPTQIFIMNKKGLSVGQATAVASARATVSSWLFVVLGATIYLAYRKTLPPVAVNVLIGIVILATAWSLLILFFIKKPESAKQAIRLIFDIRFLSNRFGEAKVARLREQLFGEIDYLSTNLKDVFSPSNTPGVLLVFASEVVAWVALFSVLPLVLFGFSVRENFAQLIFRLFILFSLTPVSPTPGGSGVVEIGFTTLLSDLIPHHIVGLVILLWRAITYYLTLGVGGLALLRFLAVSTLKVGKTKRG
jgi:uncharacterized protein (TIRG00374 family)